MNEVLLRQNMQSLQSTLSVCIHVETHLHAVLREFHSEMMADKCVTWLGY